MNKAEAISTISQIAVDAIIKAPVNREEREAFLAEKLAEIVKTAASAIPPAEYRTSDHIIDFLFKGTPFADLPSGFDGVEAKAESGAFLIKAAEASRRYIHNDINYADGHAMSVTKSGRKFVGVIERCTESLTDDLYPFKYFAHVFEDKKLLFAISACSCGKAFLVQVLRGAVRSAAMYKTKGQRHRQNKKIKKEEANA